MTPITEMANCSAFEPTKILTRLAITMPINPMNRNAPNREISDEPRNGEASRHVSVDPHHVLAQTGIDFGGSTRAIKRLPPISTGTRRFIGHRLLRPKPATRIHVLSLA